MCSICSHTRRDTSDEAYVLSAVFSPRGFLATLFVVSGLCPGHGSLLVDLLQATLPQAVLLRVGQAEQAASQVREGATLTHYIS